MICSGFLRELLVFRNFMISKSQFRCFKSVASSAVEEAAAPKPVEKERALTKLKLYWKALYRDYREVFTDSLTTVKSNPFRSTAYSILGCGLCYCFTTNPDETMFRNYFLLCTNKMNLVGSPIRNSETVEHLTLIEASSNVGVLRRLSLGLFSLMWLDEYSCDSCLYKAVCPHLGVEFLKFHERILDIGFLGRWWILEKKMVDYDINPNEWPIST